MHKVAKAMRAIITFIICIFCTSAVFTQTYMPRLSTMRSEMRGIWVATVGNIDWPTSPNQSVDQLKKETDKIIQNVKNWGLNTIFLQVRPSSDAIYKSQIEPLSPYICSRPELEAQYGDFDALSYWIDQCHKNGIELHAWINPFRVTQSAEYQVPNNHLKNTHPEWLISYGGKLYLDPGIPQARQYVLSVVEDIVDRYDVDGIHFDDYFYPYPVGKEVFGDSISYKMYNDKGLSVANWRRDNVTTVISDVYKAIKGKKSWVMFGVSPFGVWRNASDDERGSQTKAGITNYDILFADVCDWVEKGAVDYLVPQIYWEAGNAAADFDVLTEWWSKVATDNTKIFVGHAVFKVNASKGKLWGKRYEIEDQIKKVRKKKELGGSIFFSYRQFLRNINGLQDKMTEELFKYKSLPNFDETNSIKKEVQIKSLEKKGKSLRWELSDKSDTANVRYYVVYKKKKEEEKDVFKIQDVVGITSNMSWALSPAVSRRDRGRYVYRVSAITKDRHETSLSERCTVKE